MPFERVLDDDINVLSWWIASTSENCTNMVFV